MRFSISFPLLGAFACLALSACMPNAEKKPVGPRTETSKIPWNQPISGQGQGQFGMMPTSSQYRR